MARDWWPQSERALTAHVNILTIHGEAIAGPRLFQITLFVSETGQWGVRKAMNHSRRTHLNRHMFGLQNDNRVYISLNGSHSGMEHIALVMGEGRRADKGVCKIS